MSCALICRALLTAFLVTLTLVATGLSSRAGTFPGGVWAKATPQSQHVDPTQLNIGIDIAQQRGGQGMVVRNGYLIASWGDIYKVNTLASATKSWASLVTGLAIADGLIPSQSSKAQTVYPGFVEIPNLTSTTKAWLSQITIHELLTMTAGFGANGDGYAQLKYAPGSTWFYSNSAADALGDVVTWAYKSDLLSVLQSRILAPIGVQASEVSWQVNQARATKILGKPNRAFGSGIITDLNAMARVGLLMANKGNWNGRQVLQASYVADATHPHADVAKAKTRDECTDLSQVYGLLWFTNARHQMSKVPSDAFWQWGNSDRITLVVPSLNLVVARTGGEFPYKVCYDGIETFFDPIVTAMR